MAKKKTADDVAAPEAMVGWGRANYMSGWGGEKKVPLLEGYGVQVHLICTATAIIVATTKFEESFRVYWTWIDRIEIDEWSGAYSSESLGPLSRHHGPTAGIVIALTNGTRILFRFQGPPVQARSWIEPIFARHKA